MKPQRGFGRDIHKEQLLISSHGEFQGNRYFTEIPFEAAVSVIKLKLVA